MRTPALKISLFFAAAAVFTPVLISAQEEQKQNATEQQIPAQQAQAITVNGDTVEYLGDSKEISATGNVSVVYKGTKLSCKKLVVNTQTKEGQAEGGVRIEDAKGIIEGERVSYNFQTKVGYINDAAFRFYPFFGRAEKGEKVSDNEFIARRGYMSTCDLDKPHYRFRSRRMNCFPGDKIQTRDTTVYFWGVPVANLPEYNQSLADPIMHVQLMPGNRKDWGPYMLSTWRYKLTDNLSGRINLDFRQKLGIAEGFGANYQNEKFGKGDLKVYYTDEHPDETLPGEPTEFQRSLVRWRHKWEIDDNTSFISEYYQISDEKRKKLGNQNSFLKDYFFREFEKDSEPLTYALLHHSFPSSTVDFYMQKRTNHWFSQIDKMPEVKYTVPNLRLGESPFYFENLSAFDSLNMKVESENTDLTMNRLDTSNKFSLPMKVSVIRLTPFVMNRATYYDKDVNGKSISPRTIFYSGADASTKFFRIFNVKSNFLGMDINGLRHIITPTVAYSYNHKPSISSSRLKQIDSVDSIARSNSASLLLSNKLQTKRKNKTVDFLDFRVSSNYTFKTGEGGRGGNLGDLFFDTTLLPYSWMRLDADATYSHYNDYFSSVNYDVGFNFGKGALGIGQRYQRKSNNEITGSFKWTFNPKWRLSVYERFYVRNPSSTNKGLQEQEYVLTRDLHCWEMDIAYNSKAIEGDSIWMIFRLKAFPELAFNFNQSYNAPKSGAQQQ